MVCPVIFDFVFIVVSKREVLSRDATSVIEVLRSLVTSPATAKQNFERVDVAIEGYDDVPHELFDGLGIGAVAVATGLLSRKACTALRIEGNR